MRPIDEQVVLVTGATGGLGRALAQRLAEPELRALTDALLADRRT